MKDFWVEVVRHGRVTQWIIVGGGMLLCIIGGTLEFLTGDNIEVVVLSLVAAVFGNEIVRNNRKSKDNE